MGALPHLRGLLLADDVAFGLARPVGGTLRPSSPPEHRDLVHHHPPRDVHRDRLVLARCGGCVLPGDNAELLLDVRPLLEGLVLLHRHGVLFHGALHQLSDVGRRGAEKVGVPLRCVPDSELSALVPPLHPHALHRLRAQLDPGAEGPGAKSPPGARCGGGCAACWRGRAGSAGAVSCARMLQDAERPGPGPMSSQEGCWGRDEHASPPLVCMLRYVAQ
mmetsp:Transcript_67686/g.195647  ORF Transcript_67686/g.195647 Transcript_67686/m.195647 type:complete len:219 (-) Transcript_67686:9-665(-)